MCHSIKLGAQVVFQAKTQAISFQLNWAPGYSGGGGFSYNPPSTCSGNGGYDGSNGEGCSSTRAGGEGSGLDISTIPLRNFGLSPGRGGEGGGTGMVARWL